MIGSFVCSALLLWSLGSGSLSPSSHPMSRSSSRVEFEGGVVRWTLRVQHASLVEVLPGLDVDGDATLSRQEAAAGAEAIASYLAEHYTLRGSEDLSAVAWEGELVRVGAPLEPASAPCSSGSVHVVPVLRFFSLRSGCSA